MLWLESRRWRCACSLSDWSIEKPPRSFLMSPFAPREHMAICQGKSSIGRSPSNRLDD